MLTKGSALNVGKGWAVASLFRKARENRQAKFYLKSAGVDSICQCNTPFNYLFRCFELQCLSRSVV